MRDAMMEFLFKSAGATPPIGAQVEPGRSLERLIKDLQLANAFDPVGADAAGDFDRSLAADIGIDAGHVGEHADLHSSLILRGNRRRETNQHEQHRAANKPFPNSVVLPEPGYHPPRDVAKRYTRMREPEALCCLGRGRFASAFTTFPRCLL